jgi:LCP family protein required for cell wall assembly
MSPADEGGPPERPDYKVYRSRRGPKFGKPDLAGLRDKAKPKARKPKDQRRPDQPAGVKPERSTARRVLKWVAIGAGIWVLLSFLAFAISAQIQKSKLADGVGDELDGANPFLAAFPQNILVIGTDTRPPGLSAPGEETPEDCLDAASRGEAPPAKCLPYRADTLMLVRAGGGTFRKLSIPRDTLAEVPGRGPQKINSAYAAGGAKLTVQTVEGLLGIDVNEVAIVDFVGFRDFIDAVGGVEVELDQPVCSVISGGEENGGFTLDLDKGTHTLDGDEALSLSRTRASGDCNGDGAPDAALDDTDRVAFQQKVLDGIKGRLTDPLRLPYNFLKGPIIGWNAPKAMVSSMGALTMPQLVIAAGIGGGESEVLKPSGTTPAGNLVVSPEDCRSAAKKLLGEDPPREPNCPQG